MSNIQIFNFNSNQVRLQIINGKEYFCAKDVCDILEIKNARNVVANIEKDDVVLNDATDALGRIQKMSYVNEAGLYAIIFQSRKKEAKEFKRWVFNEVLPQIRKTGKYEIQEQPKLPQNYVEALEYLVKAEKEKLELQNTVQEKDNIIQEQGNQIENAKTLFKQVADKTGCVKFKACASLLNIQEKELKAILRQNKWIYLNKLFPTTDGRQDGYVKLQAEMFDVKLKSGSKVQKSNTAFYITEKGYNEILRQVSGIVLN